MNNTWKEWFVFTRKERTGILVLVTLILLVTCLPDFFSASFQRPDKAVTKALQAELLRLSGKIDSVASTKTGNEDDRYLPHYDSPADKRPIALFEFDPNTLSAEGWRKLGVRERTVQTIRKYISRGGKFRKPDDLKKIYGLSQRDAKRLMPYVRIKPAEPVKNYLRAKKEYKKPRPRIIDINTADTTALIALPGIGSKLARRIIAFREKLGGFHSIDQVKETYGITDSTLDKIRPLLQCGPGVIRTIDINTADINALSQHPYIGRNLANAIVRFRDQHGPYVSIEDLQKIVLVTPEIFGKIVHYLAVKE